MQVESHPTMLHQRAIMAFIPGSITSASAVAPLEPMPFTRGLTSFKEEDDPFFQSVLEMLLTIDDGVDDDDQNAVSINPVWPQVTAIKIPTENAAHLVTLEDDIVMTPDDQRASLRSLAHAMSPSMNASRKRLRVDMRDIKGGGELQEDDEFEDDEEGELHKRMLTNSRRDAVMLLREEARALEATLKGLHLRQSRPKPPPSNDPEALVKSYAENIQLKRAIEEQDARIKALRRAASLREGKATPGNLVIR